MKMEEHALREKILHLACMLWTKLGERQLKVSGTNGIPS